MRHHLYLFLLTFIVLPELHAQEKDSITVELQPIVVTANRMPTNALYVSRSIDVIDQQMITSSGAVSVEELLQRGSNVNVQPRGIFGVQSDASIRGAMFSQQLMLLNGARVNDVQTAHHNFDLPIPVEQIERIEVLKGPGSALYGPDAYGGVINIITRTPERQALRLKLSGGENGLVNTSGGYDFSASGIHSSNVIEHRRSDGYHDDTEFRITNISSNNKLQLPIGTYSLFGGYTKKEFGASNFYGSPFSKEWTETTFLNAGTEFSVSSLLLQAKVNYRRHFDQYMVNWHTPNTLVFLTTANVYGGEFLGSFPLNNFFSLVTGTEVNIDNIHGTSIGTRKRSWGGVFASIHGMMNDEIIVDVGAREDFHSDYGQQFNPSGSASYLFGQRGKVFVTIGRSFRAPSYTELYYVDPANQGNTTLKPETGWSYELGSEYQFTSRYLVSASVFERDEENVIDFVQYFNGDPFHAINFSRTVRGIETAFQWHNELHTVAETNNQPLLQNVSFSYTYLDSYLWRVIVFKSRYSFLHPRHQLTFALSGIAPLSIAGFLSITHKIKLNGTNYTLVDAKFSRMFFNLNVFIQGTNLLNQSYEEIAGVPLPGRWLWGGLEYKIF